VLPARRPNACSARLSAIADGDINLSFVLAQVVGRKYAAVFGFESDADAARAASLIKKASSAQRSR
jgi:hypothetical protein